MLKEIIPNSSLKIEKPKDRICFVIMPSFDKSSNQHPTVKFGMIYKELIVPTIEGYNRSLDEKEQKGLYTYKCEPPESPRPGSITKYLLEKIATSELVIADLTDFNPNVFIELGIRFSFRPTGTILIYQLNQDRQKPFIPFYLHDLKIVFYSPDWTEEIKSDFKKRIENCIVAIEKDPSYYDSPVYIHNVGDITTDHEDLKKEREKNEALNEEVQEGLNKIIALERLCKNNNIEIFDE